MTPQSTFMITAPIRAGQRDSLETLLASINTAPGLADPHNALLPFWQFDKLHVARFTILDALTNEDITAHGVKPGNWPATLCFFGDIDGDRQRFLAEMVIRAEPGLRRIFSHCEGFTQEHTELLAWLLVHSKRPAANYVNWRGRTVLQVREELALARSLSQKARDMAVTTPGLGSADTWRQLVQYARAELAAGHLTLSPPETATAGWYLRNLVHLLGVPLLLLLFSPLLALAAPFYLVRLRRLEKSDPQNTRRAESTHVESLASQEDIDVTNHFNVFGQVKPGPLRLFTIRMGLLLLDYSARHIYRRGYLTRIHTIHFARWVLLDDNRRVFFASNYDGSADSYMDDFINKVAWGLNLVFSNGVGYPRCRWLIKGGAWNEENYKRTLRRNQLPSASWYKAFPGLTAVDMARNSRIRQCLESARPDDNRIRECLNLL